MSNHPVGTMIKGRVAAQKLEGAGWGLFFIWIGLRCLRILTRRVRLVRYQLSQEKHRTQQNPSHADSFPAGLWEPSRNSGGWPCRPSTGKVALKSRNLSSAREYKQTGENPD